MAKKKKEPEKKKLTAEQANAYIAGEANDVGMDIFNRGLCLPSDNKMTPEQQDVIIEVIKLITKTILVNLYALLNSGLTFSKILL